MSAKKAPRSKKHPILLAVDTSTRTAGMAIYNGAQVLAESIWSSNLFHTVELPPAIENALQKIGVKGSDIDAVAVATGPGSFTGMRIGIAFAKGLALARRIPILGIPSLDGLVASYPPAEFPLVAMLQAGRGHYAAGWYEYQESSWQQTKPPYVLTLDELQKEIKSHIFICGELGKAERIALQSNPKISLASPAFSLRRPSFIAELAWKRWQIGQTDDPTTLSPIYLHHHQPIPG